ncbi:hypothetical protein EPO04_01985 [Patescibacteria group bacterium]|nr:MAG: hypothetical protein EPO04_01985 [Patescibacteria group bacterium]
MLANPVRIAAALPIALSTAPEVNASSPTTAPVQKITFTTQAAQPVTIPATPQPNIETEVIEPLRQAQAAKAEAEAKAAAIAAAKEAQAKVAAKATSAATTEAAPAATGDAWYKLRLCESGNDYTKNTGNGYYGAYQYNIGTWNNYGGFARPDLAPAAVQDAKAQADYARRGFSPWPACSKRL